MATWGPIQLRLKGSRQVEFDGEVSPAPGGSMPGASRWIGPFICQAAEFQTLTVTGTSGQQFKLGFFDNGETLTWAASTVFPTNAYVQVLADVDAATHVFVAEQGGQTGTDEPAWPTDGGTVVDGAVTWRDLGAVFQTSTDFINFDATAIEVQAALDAVSPGVYECSGGPCNSEDVLITVQKGYPAVLLVHNDGDATATTAVTVSTVNNDPDSRDYLLATLDVGDIVEDVLVQRVTAFDSGSGYLITTQTLPDGSDDWFSPHSGADVLDMAAPDPYQWLTGTTIAGAAGAASIYGANVMADGIHQADLPSVCTYPGATLSLEIISLASATQGELRAWVKIATAVPPPS